MLAGRYSTSDMETQQVTNHWLGRDTRDLRVLQADKERRAIEKRDGDTFSASAYHFHHSSHADNSINTL